MEKRRKLIIVGCGETASIAYEFFSIDSRYEPICFAIDNSYINSNFMYGLPVESIDNLINKYSPSEHDVFVAISSKQLNYPRALMCLRIKQIGYKLATFISSEASVWRNVEIGENCLVLPQTILQPFSIIKNNVFMWVRCNIGHRSVIEDNNFLATADVAGFSKVKNNCFLGVHSIIGDEVEVSENNFIGMGCCISRNTKPNSMYVGNPAKKQPITSFQYLGISNR